MYNKLIVSSQIIERPCSVMVIVVVNRHDDVSSNP